MWTLTEYFIMGENLLKEIEKQLNAAVQPVLQDPSLHNDGPSLEKLKLYYYKKKYIQRILARLGD